MLRVKIYNVQMETVGAVCDDELYGRTLREGRMKLDVNEFYGGDRVEEDSLPKFLKCATNLNMVGERCIDIAVECGCVDRSGVISIDGIPHAMVFYV